MNSTSFTSINESSDGCASSNGGADKIVNIDTSSTAHLTLNNNPPSVSGSRLNISRSARSSNNSDSDPDRSPSVTVLTATGNNHHLHHSLSSRSSHLITSGFSLSNRIHLTKHQRTLWSRATNLEKVLLIAVLLLATTSILLFTSLISILISQPKQYKSNETILETHDNVKTATSSLSNNNPSIINKVNNNVIIAGEQSKSYCLTPDCVKVAASVIEAIDLTVDPCDDFYVSNLITTNICISNSTIYLL